MKISRKAVRKLVEEHARRQFIALGKGRWNAEQNDIADEMSDAVEHVRSEAGDVAAEQFRRVYTEEVLALERDMRADPVRNARRLYGDLKKYAKSPAELGERPMMLEAPQRKLSPGAVLLLILVGGFLAILL